MERIMKRVTAMGLALILILGQLAMPVIAEGTEVPPPAENSPQTAAPITLPVVNVPVSGLEDVNIPSAPNGGTAQVPVEITVSQNTDGTVTAKASVQGGTDTNGAAVNASSTVKIQENGDGTGTIVSEDTKYNVVSADGTFSANGGKTIETSEVDPSESGDLELDLVKDGKGQSDADATGGKAPETTGDLKADDPANYDQTTTGTTDRTAEGSAQVEFTSGLLNAEDLYYVDENGNMMVDAEGNPIPIDPTAYDFYTYGETFTYNNETEGWKDGTNYGWGAGSRIYFYSVSVDENGEIITDENGNMVKKEYKGEETATQRVVYYNNGTPDDLTDDVMFNGLYCVDKTTGIRTSFDYRMVNLEDAVEENYYTKEEANHLRAIMNNGYDWKSDDPATRDLQQATELIDRITSKKNTLTESVSQLAPDSDEAKAAQKELDLLNKINLTNLTQTQAASATNMAIWHYGNRIEIPEGEALYVETADKNVQALYEWLITLSEEATEDNQTTIINEDKFIDDMVLIIGDKADTSNAPASGGVDYNGDDDDTNDVYNVAVKFSMVVMPNPLDDNLLVSVLDSEGNVLKTVRIAGETTGSETKIEAENGYYMIEGIPLQEGDDNVFNLKLEGTQQLQEGVYVFQSEKKTLEEAVQATYDKYTADEETWITRRNKAVSDLRKKGFDIPEDATQFTKEDFKKYIPYLYYGDHLREDGTFPEYIGSQNFIGKQEGAVEVSANMAVTFNFSVDEAQSVTIHEWRQEADPRPAVYPGTPINGEDGGGGGGAIPMVMNLDIPDEPVPMVHEPGVVILDEEVPLADAPGTGDASLVWAAMSMMSMGGYVYLGKKEKKPRKGGKYLKK